MIPLGMQVYIWHTIVFIDFNKVITMFYAMYFASGFVPPVAYIGVPSGTHR